MVVMSPGTDQRVLAMTTRGVANRHWLRIGHANRDRLFFMVFYVQMICAFYFSGWLSLTKRSGFGGLWLPIAVDTKVISFLGMHCHYVFGQCCSMDWLVCDVVWWCDVVV
jgi:hypothetical protein